MNPIEIAATLALIVLLLGLAGYFGLRQRRTLLILRQPNELSPQERGFLHAQVRRRVLCCLLMVILAAFLAGWFFLDDDFREVGAMAAKAVKDGDKELEQFLKESLWFYTGYWIFALVVLMVIIALAGADMLATARYGLRNRKQLQSDHHVMLAMELARLRERREETR